MLFPTPKAMILCAVSALSLAAPALSREVTVQVQMTEYDGEEAYFALYLTDPDGRYLRSLWVSGPEQKYHKDLARWWRYAGRSDEDFDAITGASTASGGRAKLRIDLSDEELAGGYGLTLETAVEDQRNIPQDAQIALSEDMKGQKVDGQDYVRFIRYKW